MNVDKTASKKQHMSQKMQQSTIRNGELKCKSSIIPNETVMMVKGKEPFRFHVYSEKVISYETQ